MKKDELRIVYEDRWLIAVEKPSGMLTMSTGKTGETTAYSIVYDYMQEKYRGGRIFIVHRLDRDTSGVLIFAKDRHKGCTSGELGRCSTRKKICRDNGGRHY